MAPLVNTNSGARFTVSELIARAKQQKAESSAALKTKLKGEEITSSLSSSHEDRGTMSSTDRSKAALGVFGVGPRKPRGPAAVPPPGIEVTGRSAEDAIAALVSTLVGESSNMIQEESSGVGDRTESHGYAESTPELDSTLMATATTPAHHRYEDDGDDHVEEKVEEEDEVIEVRRRFTSSSGRFPGGMSRTKGTTRFTNESGSSSTATKATDSTPKATVLDNNDSMMVTPSHRITSTYVVNVDEERSLQNVCHSFPHSDVSFLSNASDNFLHENNLGATDIAIKGMASTMAQSYASEVCDANDMADEGKDDDALALLGPPPPPMFDDDDDDNNGNSNANDDDDDMDDNPLPPPPPPLDSEDDSSYPVPQATHSVPTPFKKKLPPLPPRPK